MKITLSVIKADIGSIGGHLAPSRKLLETVREHVEHKGKKLLIDSYVSHTGDDIAILSTHKRGARDEAVHRLAWEAFRITSYNVCYTKLLRVHREHLGGGGVGELVQGIHARVGLLRLGTQRRQVHPVCHPLPDPPDGGSGLPLLPDHSHRLADLLGGFLLLPHPPDPVGERNNFV